jgi:uncharacterized protein YwqG
MNTEKVMTMLRSRGLEGIAEPCLRFRTHLIQENDLRVGSSKLGGSPDLPIGIPWPTWHGRPLDFLLQLDLTEIPRNLAEDLLPERGWIYFFYDIERNTWGYDVSHRGSWRVVFFDGDRKTLAPKKTGFRQFKIQIMQVGFFRGHSLELALNRGSEIEIRPASSLSARGSARGRDGNFRSPNFGQY